MTDMICGTKRAQRLVRCIYNAYKNGTYVELGLCGNACATAKSSLLMKIMLKDDESSIEH